MRAGTRLGVDVGDVRVGLAASDPGGILASPIQTLQRDVEHGRDQGAIAEVVAERDVLEVFVGLPRSLSGGEGPAARAVRGYATALAARISPTPVRLVDERLTTVDAHRQLRDSGLPGRAQRAVVDQAAAVLILQAALDTERTSGQPPGELVGGRKPRSRREPQSKAGGPGAMRRGSRGAGNRKVVVILVALGLVIGTGAVAVSALWPLVASFTESNDYTGNGSGTVPVVVHSGDTSRAIGATLSKAGVVKTARAFTDAAAGNPRSGSIQPGTYTLHAKMSAVSALAILVNPVNRSVPTVTIREGLWTSEAIRVLSAATHRPLAEYTSALKNLSLLGLPAQANGNPQGYLFPSTYAFEPGATAGQQLEAMVAKSLDELRRLGVPPERMQRVLTVASLVEAEARAGPDQPKVARVVENRLAKAMPLQMDSTVHYIWNRRGKAGTSTAERRSKNPYNTYLVKGLPPGPINNPGLAAMQAALHPTPGPWVYFVAVNPETGQTLFSANAAGHASNVKLFLSWCSHHPGKC